MTTNTTASNLEALAQIKGNALAAALAAMDVAVVTATPEMIAERAAAQETERLSRAERRRQGLASRPKAPAAAPSQLGVVIPPTDESRRIAAQTMARKSRAEADAETREARTAQALEDDKSREASRVAEEKAWQEKLTKGLELDRQADAERKEREAEEEAFHVMCWEAYPGEFIREAGRIAFETREACKETGGVHQALVVALSAFGFEYAHDEKHDAVYRNVGAEERLTAMGYKGFGDKHFVTYRLRNAAVGADQQQRAHKPRGSELLTKEQLAERQKENAELRAKGKAARKKVVVKTPKAPKEDGKKAKKQKRGGQQQ